MLYTIVLTYTRPMAEVEPHLESHKAWLLTHLQQSRVIFAGPLEPRTGGLILAVCNDAAELDAMMRQDPYIAHEVAQFQAFACAPGLASADFPAKWAPDATFIADQ